MSRKKSRTKTLAENREKRAKKIAIGGGVVLVALVAFEVTASPQPQQQQHDASAGRHDDLRRSGRDARAHALDHASRHRRGRRRSAGRDSDGEHEAAELGRQGRKRRSRSSSRSATSPRKDPFVQQVSSTSPTGSSTTASSGTSASTAPPAVGTAAAGGPNTTPRKQARALAGASTATISINGRLQTVRVGASFPSANPLFRLVSVTHGVARIGIANGSYCERRADRLPRTGRDAHARRHGRRHPLQASADLRGVA